MALFVQKYGGSSVADPDRIRGVARRAVETVKAGHRVVVVVSAMGKTTDGLIRLAREVTETPSERELDVVLATGEQVSIALLAMAIEALGQPARSFTGPQAGIRTDAAHTRARILGIGADQLQQALDEGRVAVVAGFQGVSEGGELTTLGRGGSDLTAVALAAALRADVCEIYTDVDGVYTADPNVVPDARKLPRVSYDEMLEMASLGAKVLQSRSVEFAKRYGVPVHVRSTFKADPGTLVTMEDPNMESVLVTSVTHDRGHAKVSILRVPDRPGIAAQIFGAVADHGMVVDMIVQNISRDGYTDISFTLPRTDRAKAVEVLSEVARRIDAAGVAHDDRVAKVSIVGTGMRSHSGVAARMFQTLSREGINIQMISTSEIAVSCVIEDKYTELAVRALHDTFELAAERR
jgi:aspartate kinase